MASMIELIKELRDRTGAGMMDCKRALEATESDINKAIDWLREKGIAKAQAKASRIAAEGLADIVINDNVACIAEVNCETDFVAKGDNFHKLVKDAIEVTLSSGSKCIDCAKEATKALFADATVAMGEKLDYRRFEIVKKLDGQAFGRYVHSNGKIASLVVLDKDLPDLAKGLAMHIAQGNPKYVSEADIPAETIAHERAIALEAAKTDEKLKNKPENILAGIIEGKVKKTLSESVLTAQTYLIDGEKTVGQVLKEAGANVVTFVRYEVGDGIEKRVDNFAEEVMKEVK